MPIKLGNIFADVDDDDGQGDVNTSMQPVAQTKESNTVVDGEDENDDGNNDIDKTKTEDGLEDSEDNDKDSDLDSDGDGNIQQDPDQTTIEIEIDQDEYDHLKDLDSDQLIAFGVKHRNSNKTLQSKIDKLRNLVGDEIVKDIDSVPPVVGTLLKNLKDDEFQKHIVKFFDEHELKDDKYVRVKDSGLTMDTLVNHAKATVELANINILDFYEPDEHGTVFDYTEAMTSYNSASAKALRKYEAKRKELETVINNIHNQVGTATSGIKQPSKDELEANAEKLRRNMIAKYPELKDEKLLTEFDRYVKESQSELLSVFYSAFKAQKARGNTTKKLVVNEITAINKNRGKKVVSSTAAKVVDPSKLNLIKKTERDAVLSLNNVFGDLI